MNMSSAKSSAYEFTLEIDHLDVIFVEEDLHKVQVETNICVIINNKTDSVSDQFKYILKFIKKKYPYKL